MARRLAERAPELGVRNISRLERLPGGLSFQTFRFEAETRGGRERFILRREPEGGVLEPYDIGRETAIWATLTETAVPAPRPLYVEDDPEVLGRRFVVCDCIDGETFTHADPAFSDERLRAETLERFVDMLAGIHRSPLPPLLSATGDRKSGAQRQVALWRERLAAVEIVPRPVLRHVLDRLEAAAPSGHPEVLVHGDYRLSNLLWRKGEIVGVLDWERAFRGDPMADVAFTQIELLNGWCAVDGDAALRYTKATGFEVEPERLAFWRVLELLKTVVVGMGGAPALARGRSSDLRLLSVSTTAAMLEPMLLHVAATLPPS